MLQSLTIDETWINLDHVVKAEYSPAYAGGEQSDDMPPGKLTKPRAARLVITLTSLTLETETDHDGENPRTASVSETVKIVGENAVKAWALLNYEPETEE